MPAPLLVFGWGNASRGDDALGPLCLQRLARQLAPAQRRRVDLIEDYQLQIEHVLDLRGRQRVLFVDASVDRGADDRARAGVDAPAPFTVAPVVAAPAVRAASHALSPAELLCVYRQTQGGGDAPPCTLLAIRGRCFALGAPLSDIATSNLAAALDWACHWVGAP